MIMSQPHSVNELLTRAQQEAASEILQDVEPAEVAPELAENALEFTDRMIVRGLSQSPRSEQPACAIHCTSCCHLHTTASVPEVILLAERVRVAIVPLEPLRENLSRHITQTTGLNANERRQLRLPCPLLKDGMCLVYEARPLVCRGWNSLEKQRCEADLVSPERGTQALLNLKQYRAASHIAQGLANAIQSFGLDARPLDLVRGLAIALEHADAAARWHSGDNLFASAVQELVFPPSA